LPAGVPRAIVLEDQLNRRHGQGVRASARRLFRGGQEGVHSLMQ
jgi:hypothetical protein